MRINKYLSSCGLGSRRKVEDLVLQGKITIDGSVVRELGYNVDSNSIVKYEGKIIKPVNDKVYIMLNKPKCYITSLKDEKDRRVVMDLLKGCKYNVFPVGRLDFNTQGLLLLTNDGDWANNIIHPSKHIAKTYEVLLKYQPTNKQLGQIRKGIIIDGKMTLPAKAEFIGQFDEYFVVNVTIYEGRNREVRKMFEFLGLKIYGLKRLKIGNLELGELEEGKFRYLSKSEIDMVFGG